MSQDERDLTALTAETVVQLNVEIQASIAERRPDRAVKYADALANTTLAYLNLNPVPEDEDE